MSIIRLCLLACAPLALAACGETSLDRAASGAAIGAGAAAVTNSDITTGAVLGAGAGVLTDPDDINLGRGPVQGS